jgi:hypothetical protein
VYKRQLTDGLIVKLDQVSKAKEKELLDVK